MEDAFLCQFWLRYHGLLLHLLLPLVLLLWFRGVESVTDPGDMAVLAEFKKGLLNPELLSEWSGDDACGVPWPHIVCQGARVSQIQVANLGLKGTLPPTLNRLSSLLNIGFQRNAFSGPLPSLNGLTRLSFAFVNDNQFDSIPEDFFRDLPSLESIALDNNPLNATTGWMLSPDIATSTQLLNLSLTNVGLTGKIPDFLGNMKSLQVLHLAYNKLDGGIPATFKQSNLRVLQANNQLGAILSGSIDAVGSMQSLSQLWLHVNNLTGVIPAGLTNASSLTDIRLNDNHLVGPISQDFQLLPLIDFAVQNNELNGPIPLIKGNFTYDGNYFCQTKPNTPCDPVVTALLEFLGSVNYPVSITKTWQGNDPCIEWTGITCQGGSVTILNLANSHLNGTISAALANIPTLSVIKLNGNALTGTIPQSFASLRSLKRLDLSNNQLSGPLPIFTKSVEVITDGNSLELGGSPLLSPSSSSSPTSSQAGNPSSSSTQSSGLNNNISSAAIASSSSSPHSKSSSVSIPVIIGPILAVLLLLLILPIVFLVLFKKKRRSLIRVQSPNTIMLYPREDGSNSDPDMVKIVVAGQNNGSSSSDAQSSNRGIGGGSSSSRGSEMQIVEAGHMVISIQVLRSVTDNFSEENILGRGGFGAVYKGELHDGTKIAVKRMEAGIISSSKGLNEFQAEIAVLSKVRHRHLVALLGYCIDGNERLLVYEHMPLGPLSKYLFEWAKKGLKPLDWKMRLTIALDVARGMEYLHGLAHKSFIHRDLKPSNILLSDDYRAKVSDFGLVKLAPEGKHSIETRLAGTFGYLAPEYAATGRVTTKSDVFSFGVVLMELITGRRALDDTQPEDSMHLVSWFRRRVHASKDYLRDCVDPSIELTDEGFEESGISTVAELAGHCTHREPSHRPDMGHVVSVLVPLLEHWKKPCDPDLDLYGGIDLEMTLPQALKKWQAYEGNSVSSHGGIYDTNESLPTCPTGFAESFTSADGR